MTYRDDDYVRMPKIRTFNILEEPTGVRKYCDPVSASLAIGSVISVAGIGAQAYSAQQNASAQNKALQYNAAVKDQQAAATIAQGNIDASTKDLQTRQLLGQQEAGYAGGGVDVNSGSSLIVGEQTSAYGALDSAAVKRNASLAAWGYTTQAQTDLSSEINPVNAGASSLLSSGGQIGGSLLNYGLSKS